jgi:CBS domain containing-hemolysin-like protein
VILALSAFLSMFFSGSETALFSLPADMLSRMREQEGARGAVVRLLDSPKRLLTTVLFGNMVVNVVFFSVSFLLVVESREALGTTWSAVLSVSSLLFVIIFCELLPKNLAVAYARPFSLLSAYPLLTFERLFWPFIIALEKVTDGIALFFGRHFEREPFIRSDELRMLIDLSEKEGVVEEDVGEMIAEVVELSEIALREVMIPRVEIVCLDIDESPEELMHLFQEHKHTLMPVYEDRVDNMLGAIHAKDFLFRDEGQDLRELIRPLPFLPESATAEEALERMREEHTRMAFVVDEYGAVEGLIAVEDVLEEIVGEIRDEYDVEEVPPVEQIGPNRYRLRGDLSVRDWSEAFEVEGPELSADTVGGLVMALLERLPRKGDKVRYRNLELTVEQVRGRRVVSVILELTEDGREAEGDD